MGIREYEQSLTEPLKQATLVFLLKEDEILLAMKKRGFGVDRWNGVGGKANLGEDILRAAVRECGEEIGVTPKGLKKVAELNFYFPSVPSKEGWNQQVLVFVATKWDGEPVETEEMRPQWFKLKDIPYGEMWPDDDIWLPRVLEGQLLKGGFVFGTDQKVEDYYIGDVESFE